MLMQGRDDAGSGDVRAHSHTPDESQEDSYTAKFESDSHVESANVKAAGTGNVL